MTNENYHEATVTNEGAIVVSEVPPDEVVGSDAFHQLGAGIQRALASWAEDVRSTQRRNRGLFQRDKYVTPGAVLEQMALAYDSADDDIVAGVLESSESISFQKVSAESEDKDQEDVWNQIFRDLNLDSWLRSAHRELMLVSQFYGVRWWGQKRYKIRGEGEGGRSRRKEYNLSVPVAMGFLDPLRVVPVNLDLFGNSDLAWIASDDELNMIDSDPDKQDRLVRRLFLGRYTPTRSEEQKLQKENIPVDRLALLNPEFVFRHTLTKGPFERWSHVRMKSLFPLLDLKHQLREMDRAWLLGGINFVVLVTRGTDEKPTSTGEVAKTAEMMRSQSKSPIIVTDHRITIEIISPEIEHVLDRDKWSVLDERLLMKMWGTFMMASDQGSRETSVTLGKVIARGLASRRHMLKRSLEKELIRMVQEHPLNSEQQFDEKTRIEFHPRHIELEFDLALVQMLQELRDRGDISRESILSEFGFDQDLEAQRREHEDQEYGDTFEPVNVPFDSPNRTTPGGSGRQGGQPPAPAE